MAEGAESVALATAKCRGTLGGGGSVGGPDLQNALGTPHEPQAEEMGLSSHWEA